MANDKIITTVAGLTDPGLVRTNNEDCFFIADPQTGQKHISNSVITESVDNNRLLMIVSDGMGGYEGGEVASRLTVRTIKSEIPRLSKRLSPQSRMEAAIEEANRLVWLKKLEDPIRRSMGATVTTVLIEKNIAYIAEIGDSRAYVLRGERIKQLTTDQTVIQVLIDSGALTPEMAAKSAHKNVLLQAIGSQEYLQVAVSSFQLMVGDVLLLCSDGLHGKLSGDEMKAIIRAHSEPYGAVEALISEAKVKGGEDNITAVIAKVDGEGLRTSMKMRTITESLRVISRFDPEVEAQPKPKLETRPATFTDLIDTAAIDHFAGNMQQVKMLAAMDNFGEYISFRRGDRLVIQGDSPEDGHYWLISGLYRVEIKHPEGQSETVALIVPATDARRDEEIKAGMEHLRVKRQFFTASLGMLTGMPRGATIFCDDEVNTVVRVPFSIYQKISEILGEKFITTVRHS